MTVTTPASRHILLRLGDSARLPDALTAALRDEVVLCGWMRASGVLADVELRTIGPNAQPRRIAGAVHAVMLEGSVGLTQGDVTCGLRAVLSRETDAGIQTLAGEILSARVLALEVMVAAFDDVTATRVLDPSGAWVLEASGVAAPTTPALAPVAPVPAPAPAAPPPPPVAAAPAATWAEAVRASEPAPTPPPAPPKPAPPKPAPSIGAPAAMPPRPARPQVSYDDQVYPDVGDVCEHFAFGRCEVVKSDGDRLHVRLDKDGRIKEIALEMLKITPLPPVDGQTGKHFKLDRRL